MDSIKSAAKTAGKAVGIYLDSGVQAKEYAAKGYDMINVQTDMVGLRMVFVQAFSEVWDVIMSAWITSNLYC